jgi:hypothetical protein
MEIVFSRFGSCVLYSATIALSFLFSKIYYNLRKKSLFVHVILIIAIVSPLSFLFAFRASSVGTDYHNYYAIGKSFLSGSLLFSDIKYIQGESTFFLIVYLLSKISFNSIPLLFFLLTFLMYLIAFLGINTLKDTIDCSCAWLFYLCVYYLFSYNILRQAFSISVVFFSIKYFFTQEAVKCFIVILIASLIHKSSCILLMLLIVFNQKDMITSLFLFSILFVFFVVFFPFFSRVMSYDIYLTSKGSIKYFVQTLFLFIPYIIYYSINERETRTRLIGFHSIAFCLLVSLSWYFSEVAVRMLIASYLFIIIIASRPSKMHSHFFALYSYLYFIVYQFVYIYLLHTTCEVIPYIFVYE